MNSIVVGSTNPVKIAAVTNVVQRIWAEATVTSIAANPGVSRQPMNDAEAIAGALNRARAARQLTQADLGIGLEGYTVDMPAGMFVSAWVVAVGEGQGPANEAIGMGASGRFLLPERVAQRVRAGAELGPLMDEFVAETNTKQRQGAVGILTNGLMQRTEALEVGVMFALTRFIRPDYYDEYRTAEAS